MNDHPPDDAHDAHDAQDAELAPITRSDIEAARERIAGDVRVMAAPVLATKGDGMRVRVEGVLGVLPPATCSIPRPSPP